MMKIKLEFGRGEYRKDEEEDKLEEIFEGDIGLEKVVGIKPTTLSTCGLDETDSFWLSYLIEEWNREDKEKVYEWNFVNFYVLPVFNVDGRFDREASQVYVGLSRCYRQITGPIIVVETALNAYEKMKKIRTYMLGTKQIIDILERDKKELREKEDDELNEFERLME